MKKLILTCFIILTSLFILSASFAQTSPAARVIWVKGNATANGRSLQKNSLLYTSDTIVTAGGSRVGIVFSDGTLMTFKEGTSYSINQYSFKKSTGADVFSGTLGTGGFRTITGAIARDNPGNYQINTPVSTIGVRGTDYQAVLKNGALYIISYSGTVCAQNLACEGSNQNGFLNWVSNPAVYMPQVLAIPDERLVCQGSPAPVFAGPLIADVEQINGGSEFIDAGSRFNGEGITFSIRVNIPFEFGDSITIDPVTGLITATNSGVIGPGFFRETNYDVTVIASNGCGSASTSFVFTALNVTA